MARKKHPPVRCDGCGGRAHWNEDQKLYVCGSWDVAREEHVGGCGRCYSEDDAPPPDDGRIREPADVAGRLAAARETAERDGRLSERDRAVHALYCETAEEHTSVEIMAADGWAAEAISDRLGRSVARQHVLRSRAKLEALGYVRRLTLENVTRYALKAAVEGRRAQGMRPAVLIEVRRPPAFPTCAQCGGDIPDIQRVSKRFCSPACRKAAGRAPVRFINEAPLATA